ncbi:MAG: DUF192 domain-containing protein [Limisphaerales bacterium]
MHLRMIVLLVGASAVLWSGCGQTAPPAPAKPAQPAAASSSLYLDHAQPKLPTVRLWIGKTEVEAEVCTTIPQVATGLMFRDSIGTNDAMLFVFRDADQRGFYMKNVKFPIALAYIDSEGAIQQIAQLKAFDTNSVMSESSRIQFVLETAPDFFARHGIAPGTVVTTPKGRLREVLGPFATAR